MLNGLCFEVVRADTGLVCNVKSQSFNFVNRLEVHWFRCCCCKELWDKISFPFIQHSPVFPILNDYTEHWSPSLRMYRIESVFFVVAILPGSFHSVSNLPKQKGLYDSGTRLQQMRDIYSHSHQDILLKATIVKLVVALEVKLGELQSKDFLLQRQ